jgi:hypothetical protein
MQGIFWLAQDFQASEEVFCSIHFNILLSCPWVYCLWWGMGIRNQFPAGPEILLFTLIQNLVGAILSAFLKTSPKVHLVSSTVGTGSVRGVKWPEHGIDCLPLSSTRVKEIWELYFGCPSGCSWPILGRTLAFLPLWQKKIPRTRTVCKLGLFWSNQGIW